MSEWKVCQKNNGFIETYEHFLRDCWRTFMKKISLLQVKSSLYLNRDDIIPRWVIAYV